MKRQTSITLWILNSAGFLGYLVWLVKGSSHRIFYTQDGVLYLLPCLPFFFVFFSLLRQHPSEAPSDDKPPQQES